jgi:preprotein translocase subunit SecY
MINEKVEKRRENFGRIIIFLLAVAMVYFIMKYIGYPLLHFFGVSKLFATIVMVMLMFTCGFSAIGIMAIGEKMMKR